MCNFEQFGDSIFLWQYGVFLCYKNTFIFLLPCSYSSKYAGQPVEHIFFFICTQNFFFNIRKLTFFLHYLLKSSNSFNVIQFRWYSIAVNATDSRIQPPLVTYLEAISSIPSESDEPGEPCSLQFEKANSTLIENWLKVA